MARRRTTEPHKPEDARARRSIQALQDSLLELLKHKPLEQIGLKEITDHAGLSHVTFFRRFASKEDLLKHTAEQEVQNLLRLGDTAIADVNTSSSRGVCDYVQARRGLWRTLLTGGAVPVMREEFVRISAEIASVRARANPWIPIDLAVPFVAAGIFEIFAWWMRQPDDYPEENVIALFDALIIDTVGRQRKVSRRPPSRTNRCGDPIGLSD